MNRHVSLAKYPHLILTHIPVRGCGYHYIHNFDRIYTDSRNEITWITDRMRNDLLELYDSDNCNHSIFELCAIDKNIIQVFASRIHNDLTDEMGRKGLMFGVFFRTEWQNFHMANGNKIQSLINEYFAILASKHQEVRLRAETSSDKQILINEFLTCSRQILNTIDISFNKNRRIPSTRESIRSFTDGQSDHHYLQAFCKSEPFRMLIKEAVREEVERYIGANDCSVLTRILKRVYGGNSNTEKTGKGLPW